jgi:hypothetical protein
MAPENTGLLVSTCNRGKGFWRTAHHQAWTDLKTRWRRGLFWVTCILVFSVLVYEIWFLAMIFPKTLLILSRGCQPDGTFSLDPNDYNYWDASGFFQITIPYGTLKFSQAKVIDVVWDVVGFFFWFRVFWKLGN